SLWGGRGAAGPPRRRRARRRRPRRSAGRDAPCMCPVSGTSGSVVGGPGRTSLAAEPPSPIAGTRGPRSAPPSAGERLPAASTARSPPDLRSPGRSGVGLRLGLLLVLVIGFGLRTFSAGYGLPDLYHPDEPKIVERAVRFHQGDLNPRFFNYPSLYMYALAGVSGLVFGAS